MADTALSPSDTVPGVPAQSAFNVQKKRYGKQIVLMSVLASLLRTAYYSLNPFENP